VPLCADVLFDCGAGGSPTGNCGNSALGAAMGCTVLELGANAVSITGPPGGIQGNVCIAPHGKLSLTGSEFLTGNIALAPGATLAKSGSGTIGGSVLNDVDLNPEIDTALTVARFAGAELCTQNFTQLNTTATIVGSPGLNVICVNNVVLNSATITLQ